jgi:NitT/TauT family transport system permease protein
VTALGRSSRSGSAQMGALLGLLALWELAVRLLALPKNLLPAPSVVLAHTFEIRTLLVSAAGYTASTALGGYLGALLVGVLLGVVFAHSPALQRGVFAFFVASQAVPVIAFSAIVILWLGNGPLSKVAIAFYLSFFPITVNTVKGLQSCDPMAVSLLRTFGAGPWQTLWKLRMPATLPFLFVALRVATTTALIGAIVGEWFGDNKGIGTLILQALYTEDTVRLWSGIVACAAMGVLFYGAVTFCERRLLWWPAPTLDS